MVQSNEPRGRGDWRAAAAATAALLGIGGCSTLPASGPTGHEIERAAANRQEHLPFNIVEVETAAAVPPAPGLPIASLATLPPPPTDLVGPGDVLDITIYESGVALFGNSALKTAATNSQAGMSFDPSANAEKLPPVRVDDNGYIRLPFVGRLRAMGHTTVELQTMIRNGLHGMSQNPQVMVTIAQSITNSVILAGEVTKPGRLVLVTNRESLNDAIALAGGYKGEAKDVVARVQRKDRSFEIRLSDLLNTPEEDLQVAPGDRITLISRPQTFSVLGAPNKIDEIRFPRSRTTLAQAVALVGGANADRGDAAAIFVFRYVPQPDGKEQAVVYHVNMMRAGAYFLSQHFMMQDKDLLYIGNARANQPSKLIQLISQLFLPVATVRNASGV